MNNRHITGSVGALLASGVVASCLSSAPTGPVNGEDAGIVVCSSDASVVSVAAQVDAGLCSACVQSQCGALLTTCSTDCACNNSALQALGCVESLGATPTPTAITSCITALGNSTDGTLDQLATCLQGCAGACGVDASVLEAGPDATVAEAGVDSSVADTGSDVAVDTGVDANVDSPSSCTTTSISGTVYDPAGNNPLPGVSVYVPTGGLVPFTSGAVCSCSGLGSAYGASAVTDAHGQFTLTGVPAEGTVSVVAQTGKWRRTFPVAVTPCVNNPVAAKMQLPSIGSQGDMPEIAVSTGGGDTLECLLSRIGIGATEWVGGAGTGGHVHVFSGGVVGTGADGIPEATTFTGATPSSTTLWDKLGDLTPYDVLLLSCEGGETYDANPSLLESYVNVGGRVLASHFQYSWFAGALVSGQEYTAPPDWGPNLAAWTGGAALGDGGTTPTIGAIPQTTLTDGGTFPKGVIANAWLGDVGALTSGEVPILTPKYNATVSSANGASQPWLIADGTSGSPGAAMLFTFDTPIDTAAPEDGGLPPYCGRIAFTDLHDDGASDTSNTTSGKAAPLGCGAGPLSAQEKELELLFFDLEACVVPDTASPPSTPP